MLKERGDSMAINDNTTRLGSSFSADGPKITARDFNDYTARSISQSVAKANYRKSSKSDFKVAELRKYVYKMVTSWSEADKKAILAQYGSSDAARGEKLDEAVTETLIINLKETDLQIILNDIRGDEANLSKKVRDIRQMKRREASKFSTRTFGEVFENIKNVKKTKDITKELKKYDKTFKIPKNVRNAFPRLKRELMETLPLIYDRVQLAILASKMGLVIPDKTSEKDVINMIVNKTLLYVALITGKTKESFSGAILDPEPFKEVLKYTSYSWAGGSSGLTSESTKSLRAEAIANRLSMKSQFYKTRDTVSIGKRFTDSPFENIGKGLLKGIGGAGKLLGNTLLSPITLLPALLKSEFGKEERFDDVTGDITKKGEFGRFFETLNVFGLGRKSDQKRLEKKATDNVTLKISKTKSGDPKTQARFAELMAKSEDELIDIGRDLGLKKRDLTSQSAKEKYVKEILAIEEMPKVRKEALEKKKDRLSKKGFIAGLFGGKKLSEEEEEELKIIEDLEKEKKEKNFSGTKLPYARLVTVPTDPNLKSIADFAIPVWVVNNGQIGTTTPTSLVSSLAGPSLDFVKGMGQKASDNSLNLLVNKTLGDIKDRQAAKDLRVDYDDSTTKDYSGIDKSDTIFKGLYKGDDPFIVDIQYPDEMFNSKGTRALRVIDVSPAIMANKNNTANTESARRVFSSAAVNLGIVKLKNEPATPVYITNQSLPTDAGKLILGLARILLRILVPVGGGLIADQLDAMASGTGGIDQLLEMAGLATGGKGRAVGSLAKKTTHFISGDSLNKKPNPEQVSVNWANKSYTVKPIPQFAEGGGQSASGQITRMTSTERNKPMSVGISSHLVTYNRELQGASDNGDKQALKVYSVNPGITDMVDVNGLNVSLIGLVSDAVIRLSNIEGLLSVNNQQNDATIAATSAVAANINRLKSSSSGKSGMNPFAGGFPSDLDEILTGV
jgi:hypothetical protein